MRVLDSCSYNIMEWHRLAVNRVKGSFYATRTDPPKGGTMILVTEMCVCVCVCVCICVCVCVFIKLHTTTQSGPVILVILCHSH